ncbi:MAG: GTP-binding protein [Candidatus Helarchaeota archaeon]|nr:GTP-binding protein [Candidatus Helarchaeota archaeon]
MVKDFIKGIIYSQFDEKAGPRALIWIPPDLPEKVQDLISLKTINILAGENGVIPESLAVVPFPSIKLKGLVKYMEIKDPIRRGKAIDSSITLLFDEVDDLIFYKYIKNFEDLCSKTVKEIVKLEEKKAHRKQVQDEINKFQLNVQSILNELQEEEVSVQESAAFAEVSGEGADLADYEYKLIVCGDPHVGKTSTILRFTDNAFRRTYIPTLGVNLSKKQIRYKDLNVKFVLWDIAGQSKFQTMRRPFYKGADGQLLVFDLTDLESFENITNWYKDIKTNLKGELRGLIIGNKNDLVDQRKVEEENIKKLSQKLDLEFFEISALTGENINEVFYKLAELIYERKNEKPSKKKVETKSAKKMKKSVKKTAPKKKESTTRN